MDFWLGASHVLRDDETQVCVCVYLQGDDPEQSKAGVLHKVPAEDQHTTTCREENTHVTGSGPNGAAVSSVKSESAALLYKAGDVLFEKTHVKPSEPRPDVTDVL